MRQKLRRLERYCRLSQAERRLLPAVAALLGLARVAIGWMGVPRARRLTARLAPSSSLDPERLAELVRLACRALPGPTACLPRAIVLEALLVRADHAAELRVGIAPRAGRDRPEAHAWVVLAGLPVGEDPVRYTALPLFGTRG